MIVIFSLMNMLFIYFQCDLRVLNKYDFSGQMNCESKFVINPLIECSCCNAQDQIKIYKMIGYLEENAMKQHWVFRDGFWEFSNDVNVFEQKLQDLNGLIKEQLDWQQIKTPDELKQLQTQADNLSQLIQRIPITDFTHFLAEEGQRVFYLHLKNQTFLLQMICDKESYVHYNQTQQIFYLGQHLCKDIADYNKELFVFFQQNISELFVQLKKYLQMLFYQQKDLKIFNKLIAIGDKIHRCYKEEFLYRNCEEVCEYFSFNQQINRIYIEFFQYKKLLNKSLRLVEKYYNKIKDQDQVIKQKNKNRLFVQQPFYRTNALNAFLNQREKTKDLDLLVQDQKQQKIKFLKLYQLSQNSNVSMQILFEYIPEGISLQKYNLNSLKLTKEQLLNLLDNNQNLILNLKENKTREIKNMNIIQLQKSQEDFGNLTGLKFKAIY